MSIPVFPDDHQTPPVVKPRRNRRSAKNAGARFERAQADWLAQRLVDDRIDRRVKRGNQDRGDITGIRTCRGDRVVIELKDVARLDLPGWLREAEVERANDDAAIGVVMHKKRGTTNPAEQYVTMTAEAFAVLIEGGL
jgi:hypothetical protein